MRNSATQGISGMMPGVIFKSLDFHLSTRYGEEPLKLFKPLRLVANYIVDSFSMRIPKKVRTLHFHKLNVTVVPKSAQLESFFAVEGIGMVEIVDPGIATIYRASREKKAERIKSYLRTGVRIAAKYDALFAKHADLWNHLLDTVDDEFDFDCRMARSHASRRWRAEAVARITPDAYHFDLLVRDSKSGQTVFRHRIKTTPTMWPFYIGIGYSRLLWDGDEVVGLGKDQSEVFRFKPKLPDDASRSEAKSTRPVRSKHKGSRPRRS